MPILIGLGVILLAALLVGPQWWVRAVMRRHAAARLDFPGTGGELARHLLDLRGLHDVEIEIIPQGDHYDPVDRVIRLTPENYDGRSVTAVAVAAHEVGHAFQHADGDRFFVTRLKLSRIVQTIEITAAVVLATAPVLMAVVRSPALLVLQIAVGVALLASRVVMHVVTLPLEFDASFRRALPILEKGRYLDPPDLPAARQVLKAAAYTYVAGALATLLDLTRLARLFRF